VEKWPLKIMFICTGNSCRSQMAEGFARALGGDRVEVYSAGTEPRGVDPRAVAVMAEVGIDISHQTSKLIDTELLDRVDLAVTLCGDVLETCPVIPGHVRHLHWGLPDPARVTGTEAAVMNAFRSVRDEIRRQVERLLATPPAEIKDERLSIHLAGFGKA